MQANELMTGDWVLIKRTPSCEYPYKICSINNYSILGEDYADWIEVEAGEEINLEDIKPIPLTAEILEKIGFHHHLIAERGFTREEWTLSDDYYDIVVSEWSDSIWVFRYECTEMNTPHEQRVFGYVHELQHALRECGIDKEIVL